MEILPFKENKLKQKSKEKKKPKFIIKIKYKGNFAIK